MFVQVVTLVSLIRERREHSDTPLRARPEVRAAPRLLPRQGESGAGRPPVRDGAHVPVHRREGWRDRVPQRQGTYPTGFTCSWRFHSDSVHVLYVLLWVTDQTGVM